jgi:hypothetical protein
MWSALAHMVHTDINGNVTYTPNPSEGEVFGIIEGGSNGNNF